MVDVGGAPFRYNCAVVGNVGLPVENIVVVVFFLS